MLNIYKYLTDQHNLVNLKVIITGRFFFFFDEMLQVICLNASFTLTEKESLFLFGDNTTHSTILRHTVDCAAGSAAMDMEISVRECTYMAMLPLL